VRHYAHSIHALVFFSLPVKKSGGRWGEEGKGEEGGGRQKEESEENGLRDEIYIFLFVNK
jgi:hypothetical protein